jgi:hypothetical protein
MQYFSWGWDIIPYWEWMVIDGEMEWLFTSRWYINTQACAHDFMFMALHYVYHVLSQTPGYELDLIITTHIGEGEWTAMFPRPEALSISPLVSKEPTELNFDDMLNDVLVLNRNLISTSSADLITSSDVSIQLRALRLCGMALSLHETALLSFSCLGTQDPLSIHQASVSQLGPFRRIQEIEAHDFVRLVIIKYILISFIVACSSVLGSCIVGSCVNTSTQSCR